MTLIKTVCTQALHFISKSWLGCLAGLMIGSGAAVADLVSPYGGETAPSFAELSVEKDHVRVLLEIDLSDYPAFVAPDDGSGTSLSERTGLTFHVAADGRPLERVIKGIDVRPRTPRQTAASSMGIPRPRSDKVVFVDMEFPFQGQPEQITFTPPLNADGIPLASIGMMAEHGEVPVTDYRYLSQPETMLPNWSDPWFTTFENPNLTRHHKSPLMSFLSVAPREVRHEVIIRLKDLEGWVDLDLGSAERLTPDQIDHIKSKATDFFQGQNPVVVDDEEVLPKTVVVSRITVGAEGLSILSDQEPATRTTMLLGVVMSYPRNALPQQVELTWQLFVEGVDVIPVTLGDPAGAVPSQVDRTDPIIRWTNHLTAWDEPRTAPVIVKTAGAVSLPFLAIGAGIIALFCSFFALKSSAATRYAFLGLTAACTLAAVLTFPLKQTIGQSTPDEVSTHQVVQGLLNNVSTAMLELDAETLQESLEPFVALDNREDVSTELRRGLSVTLPSGTVARTEDILQLQIERWSQGENSDAHQILANWTARVSGGHWGHLHRQNVNFRGLIDVSRHGDQWLLDGLTVLAAKKEG